MRKGCGVVLGVLAFCLTSSLSAQTSHIHFGIQCTPGSFRACVSLDVEATYYPGGIRPGWPAGTELRIKISNPQGLRGFEGGAFGFKGLALDNLLGTTGAARSVTARQVGTAGTATVGGTLDFLNNPHYGTGLRASVATHYDYDSNLFGCDVPVGASPFGGFDRTCDGSITISLEFVGDQLTLTNDTQLFMYGQSQTADGQYIASHRCTTGVDCVSVTPEPVTIALVGTGLAGIGLLRRRRRKNDQTGGVQ